MPDQHPPIPRESSRTIPPAPGEDGQPQPNTEHLRARINATTRAILMTCAIASVAVFAVFVAITQGVQIWVAAVSAIPIATAGGFLAAWALMLHPEWLAERDRQHIIRRIEAVAQAEREAAFDVLLAIDPRHELSDIAHALHRALSIAHRDRLEAIRLRREMNVLVEREARRQCAHLTTLTITDELTGLANRRGFEKGLADLVELSQRHNQELALLAIDLDHFKALNDTCGHEKGDQALAIAGDLLQAHVREHDLAGRMGGDELFIALYAIDAARAERVAERLIKLYASHPAGKGLPCQWPSMSIGIALLRENRAQSAAELRRFADQALYASKRAGRARFTQFRDAA